MVEKSKVARSRGGQKNKMRHLKVAYKLQATTIYKLYKSNNQMKLSRDSDG